MVALIDPESSWVAKWQRMVQNVPGLYAIEVIGELSKDDIEFCREKNIPYRLQEK